MTPRYPTLFESHTNLTSDWPQNPSDELKRRIFAAIGFRFADWTYIRKLETMPRRGIRDAHDMLRAYYERLLPRLEPRDILRSANSGTLDRLVKDVRMAQDVGNFIYRLEKKLLPEVIAKRKQDKEDAMDSWD